MVAPDRSMPQITADNWDQGGDLSRWVYLHAGEVFPSSVAACWGDAQPLPLQPCPEIGDFPINPEGEERQTLNEFLAASSLDGFIVVHRGAIVFEAYPRMRAGDRHLIFSVTKAFVGTVLGLLADEGRVDLSAPIQECAPSFCSTEWAGTSIRDIADMASGMEGSESSAAAYIDPAHKHYQLEASLGWRSPRPEMPESVLTGDTYQVLQTFQRERPAGEQQVYTSANTAVLGYLIEAATGRRLVEVIEERIWSRIGAEHDALLLENRQGIPIAHGGMAMTLRDLARFGMQFTASGRALPGTCMGQMPFIDRLFQEAREQQGQENARQGRLQWDYVSAAGELVKGGFGDQLLYIDTARDVVIAYVGTNSAVDAPPTRLPLRALVARFF